MGVLGSGSPEGPGEIQGLVQLFDTYGREILWDFQEHLNIDVLDFFTADRGWVQFYDYLSGLPSHAKFPSAVSQDPDLARAQVNAMSEDDIREIMDKRDKKDGESKNDLTTEGYTMEIEKLNQVIEEVRMLRLSMSGSKKQTFKPQDRPSTANEKYLKKRIESFREIDRNTFAGELGF